MSDIEEVKPRKRRPQGEGQPGPRRSRPDGQNQVKSRKPRIQEDVEMSSYNPAKSQGRRNEKPNRKRRKTMSKRERELREAQMKKQKKYKSLGVALAVLQIIASIVFVVSLLFLNMLPTKYVALVVFMLVLLDTLVLVGQMTSKKKAIAGKILSLFMSIVLFAGAFYVFQGYKTLNDVTGDGSGTMVQIDQMVVAVLIDDPAETIQDASGYKFGVQYSMKGDEIRTMVSNIEEELGSGIAATEMESLSEQVTALYEGKVGAIIYNSGYEGIFQDIYPNYASETKIIYSHDIETRIDIAVSEKEVADESFVVYISGIDVYGSIAKTSRSDVNILAVVNPTTHQILLVTTPRDYYVTIPGISGSQEDKLTHAGNYGVQASMDTLSAIYGGVEIDFYARVNFTSLEVMVDALGGVDVYSNQSFSGKTEDGSKVAVNQGTNHFNGAEALFFARERHGVTGGDFQRGMNQQEVIKAMIEKAISPAVITGATSILEAVSDNVDTNMQTSQIQDLIKDQIDSMASWDIKMVAAEGTGAMDVCYSSGSGKYSVVRPDQSAIDAIMVDINALLDGLELQGADTIG